MKDVCAVADLNPREPLAVRVANTDLVLTRWREKVYALRNVCPHQGQALGCGHVAPHLVSSAPGETVVADDDNPMLICPWHAWGYELETGQCVTQRSLRVRTYAVQIRDGRVFVDL